MDEGILIEIAQRFRKLEDAIEAADLFLASFKEAAERRIAKAGDALAADQITYAQFCQRVNEPHADITKLDEVRGDIKKHLEACWDDMVAMQEKLRSSVKTVTV